MKTRKIKGISYVTFLNGVMVPESLVREVGPKMRTPSDFLPRLQDLKFADVEHVVVFTLDGNNQIMNRHHVSQGLANQSQIHCREVFRPAILDGAVSVVVAHNHPSGAVEPSESDLIATRRLTEAARIIGISLLDHMIVSRIGHLSLREKYPAYFG